jgi:hypothetical protein
VGVGLNLDGPVAGGPDCSIWRLTGTAAAVTLVVVDRAGFQIVPGHPERFLDHARGRWE